MTSVFNVAVVFDDEDEGEGADEVGGGGEATDDVGEVAEEVRDGVLERIRLAAVGDWSVDRTVDLGTDVSLVRGETIILGFVGFVVVVGLGFDWLGGGIFVVGFVKC